jgi:multidrug efflux system membrane fusion protein
MALLGNHRVTLQRVVELRAKEHVPPQAVDDEQAQVGQYEGAVAMDRGQISAASLNVSFTQITAPIDGVVGMRLVDEGNLVRPDDATGIAVITQIDPIAVFFTLPQDDLPRIAARMKEGPVPVETYNRQGETLLGTGELLAIDNQVSEATAMIRLKAQFQNPQHLLWPNQVVNARLLLRVRKQALVVPAVAVQHGPSGTFIYVVQKGSTAIVRPVTVELLVGEQALISAGLAAGEEVVIEGQNQLRANAKVSAHPPAGSKP